MHLRTSPCATPYTCAPRCSCRRFGQPRFQGQFWPWRLDYRAVCAKLIPKLSTRIARRKWKNCAVTRPLASCGGLRRPGSNLYGPWAGSRPSHSTVRSSSVRFGMPRCTQRPSNLTDKRARPKNKPRAHASLNHAETIMLSPHFIENSARVCTSDFRHMRASFGFLISTVFSIFDTCGDMVSLSAWGAQMPRVFCEGFRARESQLRSFKAHVPHASQSSDSPSVEHEGLAWRACHLHALRPSAGRGREAMRAH